MAKKYEKVKLGLPAYITFACFLIAIIIMVIILIPSNKQKVRNMFSGTYTEQAEQGKEAETKSYNIGEKHVIKTCSFSSLKKKIKADKYTYILYGNTTNTDFCLQAIEVNKKALEYNETTTGKKISIIYVNSKNLSDNQKEYLRERLRKVNPEIKSISKMPVMDLWVTRNDEIIDCYSREEYRDAERSMTYIAKYKIFSYTN